VTGTIGRKSPAGLGQDALLDFRMDVTLDGETLTAAEIRQLLAKSEGLALVRGRWVEVDREKLGSMMEHFRAVERMAAETGLDFREARPYLPSSSSGVSMSGLLFLPALTSTDRVSRQPFHLSPVSLLCRC
jgi:hypothetical protein